MRTGRFTHSADTPVQLQMMTDGTDFQPWLDLNWWLLSLASFLKANSNKNMSHLFHWHLSQSMNEDDTSPS